MTSNSFWEICKSTLLRYNEFQFLQHEEKEVTELARKLFSILLAMCLLLSTSLALAAERTPKPIQTIPYEEISPTVEGQHHYLLLCTDLWKGKVRPADAPPPTQENGKRRDLYGNTDGIVLVTLDTRAHRIMLTSFIRDALIKKPNDGIGRINYVYNDYGPEALCKVISQHIDVKVEDYLLFDFTQIANIVDYLGGVDIELNASEIEYLRRYAVPAGSVRSVETGADLRSGGTHRPGLYHFKGHSAVIYMRIRKAGGGGDFMRTQRARTVMSTLADKCREITWEEAEALVNNIMDNNTMTNINLEGMLDAARYAYSLRDCTIEELRLPPDGAVTPITFAAMAAQEVDWDICRQSMANYLQNSFLVIEDEED